MLNQNRMAMALKMLELQDAVNGQINSSWRAAKNPWYRAIWTECAELTEHIGWKWWKAQAPDIPQIQLEIIDIWHFGLSDILQNTADYDEALKELDPAFNIFSTASDLKFEVNLSDVEDFASSALLTKRFDPLMFARLAVRSELTFEKIFIQYIGKNVLNRFRQDHGYKAGTYKKIWDGLEDNEWLVALANNLDSSSPTYADSLYKALSNKYISIQSGKDGE